MHIWEEPSLWDDLVFPQKEKSGRANLTRDSPTDPQQKMEGAGGRAMHERAWTLQSRSLGCDPQMRV